MYDIWEKEAINRLELHEAKKQALRNIPEQIKELEEKITCIRSSAADGITVAVSNGNRDDVYLNNIVARDTLKANLESAQQSVEQVHRALSALTDDERELLERRWIKPEKEAVKRIAIERDVDPRTVRRQLEDAIYKFVTALYG